MESARTSAAPRRKKKKTLTGQNWITVSVVALVCLLLDILLWNILLARNGGKYAMPLDPERRQQNTRRDQLCYRLNRQLQIQPTDIRRYTSSIFAIHKRIIPRF